VPQASAAQELDVAEDNKPAGETPALVDRWLDDQQQWQRTLLNYFDSMVKNEDFLVHLGNAMRGSLLAGKPYPRAGGPGAAAPETEADDRLDRILHALHEIEGQLADLRLSVDELKAKKKDKGRKDKHKD
jgi:hypothetical protein